MKLTKAELIAENNRLFNLYQEQRKLTDEWQKKYNSRLDIQMLETRVKLASSVGQLVEATSKAVMFIVGKEVM